MTSRVHYEKRTHPSSRGLEMSERLVLRTPLSWWVGRSVGGVFSEPLDQPGRDLVS